MKLIKSMFKTGLTPLLIVCSIDLLNAQVAVKPVIMVKPVVNVKPATNFHFSCRHVPGTWNAYIENDMVYIQFTGEDWNNGRTIQLADLGVLPAHNEGTFSLTREAGTITFKGVFNGGKGSGFYKFAENGAFKTYLEQKGFKGWTRN